jgi:guanylate kinase
MLPSEPISFDLLHLTPLLIVVSGPSGVGKDSVVTELQKRNQGLHFVVTTTDRSPRPNEVEGVDYNFVTTQRFQEMIANDEFIEYNLVYQDYKGVPKKQIQNAFASGSDVIMRVDVQGAARMRQLFPEAVLIFIIPENIEEWCEQLADRHSETHESLQQRIETAKKELESLPIFDYVVVNPHDHLERAVNSIQAIIEVEHLKVHPRKTQI